MSVIQIQKRDSSVQTFNPDKIYNAVKKAFQEVKGDLTKVRLVSDYVVQELNHSSKPNISIEDIQDYVEAALMHLGFPKIAKAYILFREARTALRKKKEELLDGLPIDWVTKNLSINQIRVLKQRYLISRVILDENGEEKQRIALETPQDLFERVAKTVAIGDFVHDMIPKTNSIKPVVNFDEKKVGNFVYEKNWQLFNKYNLNPYHVGRMIYLLTQLGQFPINSDAFHIPFKEQFEKYFGENGVWKKYFIRMVKGEYIFNTPVMMNFGRPLGGGNACFVLNIEDDLEQIMHTCAVRTAKIFKKAGGVGGNFSKCRPKGDSVGDIENAASGPMSWMTVVDDTTRVIKSGTGRRGANMGVLNHNHPDINQFITYKLGNERLRNFNISVGTNTEFWEAFFNNKDYPLVNPRTGKEWGRADAVRTLDLIADCAHKSAEPGMLFFDNANEYNPFRTVYGDMDSTNPCGEQYLYPNDSCTLASINLGKFVYNGQFLWDEYIKACRELTRGLDNVVSISKYPDEEIEKTTKSFRRIGLGVMGLADCLFKLRIRYDSKQGYEFMEQLAQTMHEASLKESIDLAVERGQAPSWKKLREAIDKSSYDLVKAKVEGEIDLPQEYWLQLNDTGIRNCWVGTEAPTGTISMIAECTSGIEPLFSLYYEKKVEGTDDKYKVWNNHFIQALKDEGIYSEQLLQKVVDNGSSAEGIDEIPKWIQETFTTAMNMHWADHVYAQSVWQKYVDNSISKTINLPKNATESDIKQAYILAHNLGCKGLSVYRDGTIKGQILETTSTNDATRVLKPSKYVVDQIVKNQRHILDYLPTIKENDYIEINLGGESNKGLVVSAHAFKLNEPIRFQFPETNMTVCPICKTALNHQGGCKECPSCGWAACG